MYLEGVELVLSEVQKDRDALGQEVKARGQQLKNLILVRGRLLCTLAQAKEDQVCGPLRQTLLPMDQ